MRQLRPPLRLPSCYALMENALAFASLADDGLCGSYPSKPERTIASGLPTRELAGAPQPSSAIVVYLLHLKGVTERSYSDKKSGSKPMDHLHMRRSTSLAGNLLSSVFVTNRFTSAIKLVHGRRKEGSS